MKILRILGKLQFFSFFSSFHTFLHFYYENFPTVKGEGFEFFCDFLGRAMKKLGISEEIMKIMEY